MKKKILSLIFAVLLLIPCLSFSVSADDYGITISDDYQTLNYKGNEYVRFDSSFVASNYENFYEEASCNIAEVDYVNYSVSTYDTIIEASIYLNDGSSLSAPFINKDYYSEYQYLISDTVDEYTVFFWYPENNSVAVSKSGLFGERATLDSDTLKCCEQFEVTAQSENGSFYAYKGALLIVDDEYYYVDYAEAGIKKPYDFYASDYQQPLSAAKITDAETCELITAGYSEYNGDFDWLVGELSNSFSLTLLVFIFAVIPFAALILFVILSVRAKSPAYKKIFTMIYVIAASELVVLGITALVLQLSK